MSNSSGAGALQQAIAHISVRAKNNIEKSGVETYTDEDGYLRCSICHERLTRHVELFPGEPPVLVNCVCEHTSSRRQFAAREEMRKNEVKQGIRTRCITNPEWRNFTFEKDNGSHQSLSNVLKSYVENCDGDGGFVDRGQGLLLYGGVGAGKTYLAASVINALIDKDVPCLMTSLSEIVDKTLRQNWSDAEVKAWLADKKVIAFDDLGTERDTEYANEKIFTVINSLCGAKKSLIFTTNLTLEEMSRPTNRTSARLYDRILSACLPFEVKGPSQRRAKAQAELETNKKQLGL